MARDVSPKLLEVLVCPLTKMPLHYDRERQELAGTDVLRDAAAHGDEQHLDLPAEGGGHRRRDPGEGHVLQVDTR